ncbi:hypothetical protein TREMEDRAFT_65730 [Tremella mesenterica DSM 1558]|uniref:uncharacterized protein n=1 Tax=Tremella mesenterica (strain ATCC 24925 / CBS 8224 / DSM 1558 / NBRC 9311 / NRRL Y-6157 / RJB 2259-6 / UBC 559-6) TaxID=578456 RepID=UPI00032CFB22|nr:uncharacterized protein TREMEDRAFT_65730 [Tremella mesenterica DSM 1558]EIW66136.1 hypothetical protein TREMEDRAFT_65730 [Tremella mesenterica DSM 1558]
MDKGGSLLVGFCYGVTTNRENSIEFGGLGKRTARVGGSAAPYAPWVKVESISEKGELEQGLVPEVEMPTSSSRSTISHNLTSTTTTPDPLNELSQQLSQLLAIMTMQQKEQNALREELAMIKADRQNQQLLTSKGASSIKIEEKKPCLEPKLTNNKRIGRTRKILFMYGYLWGTPQMLLTPAITNPSIWNSTKWLETYHKFIQHLRTQFGDSNMAGTAMRKLQELRQTDTAAEYFANFELWSTHLGKVPDAMKNRISHTGPERRTTESGSGTEENQRMAETMIAANQWAARRKNETTWIPPRWNSTRLDSNLSNPVQQNPHSGGRGPLPGGKPGMMNLGLPNDPPVTWTEDGGRLSENEMTWRRENRRCLKCRSPEHYANNCPNGGNTRNNIRGSPNPHGSPIPSGLNSIPTGSKGPLVRGMAVTFEEEGNDYLA